VCSSDLRSIGALGALGAGSIPAALREGVLLLELVCSFVTLGGIGFVG